MQELVSVMVKGLGGSGIRTELGSNLEPTISKLCDPGQSLNLSDL